jgi:hyaluronoglucosaminidase
MLTVLLLPLASSTVPFDVVWNSPWPTDCPNPEPAASLTRFGIRTNAKAAFNGGVVSTLYNHAGACSIGDWPALFSNGTIAANGGIPQNGSLPAHLSKVRADVAALFPDPSHDGYVVIDWEEWQPFIDPRSKSVYMQASLQYAGGNVEAAVAQWNASALNWMVETLLTVRAMRPHAKIGYYGVVGCYGQYEFKTGTCAGPERARNDALAPLWGASSALFPSIYSSCEYAGTPYPSCLPDASHDNATEAEKIPLTLREAMRVNTRRVPVVAFTWYTLYTHECAVPPPAGLGHCPLMRNARDLAAEFALAKEVGADGIIVWGSSGDVRRGTDDCDVFAKYLNATLGPSLASLPSAGESTAGIAMV